MINIDSSNFADSNIPEAGSVIKNLGSDKEKARLHEKAAGVENSLVLPVPVKCCDLYVAGAVFSSVKQDAEGIYITRGELGSRFEPVNVLCCLRDRNLCFDVKFCDGSRWVGNSVIFSAPIDFVYRGMPGSVPDSLYDCEEFLISPVSGCGAEIRQFLIDLMFALCMVYENTVDIEECYDSISSLYISNLYKESVLKRNLLEPINAPHYSQCHNTYHYIVDYKWVIAESDGTLKATTQESEDIVGYLTDFSVQTWFEGDEDCEITIRNAEHTRNKTVVDFQSINSLPSMFPSAGLQAINYLCIKRPTEKDIVTALVIGSVGWLFLAEDHYIISDIADTYFYAAELYEKQTGAVVKGIKTSMGGGTNWDESQ